MRNSVEEISNSYAQETRKTEYKGTTTGSIPFPTHRFLSAALYIIYAARPQVARVQITNSTIPSVTLQMQTKKTRGSIEQVHPSLPYGPLISTCKFFMAQNKTATLPSIRLHAYGTRCHILETSDQLVLHTESNANLVLCPLLDDKRVLLGLGLCLRLGNKDGTGTVNN